MFVFPNDERGGKHREADRREDDRDRREARPARREPLEQRDGRTRPPSVEVVEELRVEQRAQFLGPFVDAPAPFFEFAETSKQAEQIETGYFEPSSPA